MGRASPGSGGSLAGRDCCWHRRWHGCRGSDRNSGWACRIWRRSHNGPPARALEPRSVSSASRSLNPLQRIIASLKAKKVTFTARLMLSRGLLEPQASHASRGTTIPRPVRSFAAANQPSTRLLPCSCLELPVAGGQDDRIQHRIRTGADEHFGDQAQLRRERPGPLLPPSPSPKRPFGDRPVARVGRVVRGRPQSRSPTVERPAHGEQQVLRR